jgi:hypothetical protein
LVNHLQITPKNINSNLNFTEPTPAMPDDCKVSGNSLQSYHNYYVMNKSHLWSWKGKINSKGVYDTYYDKDIPYREVMNLYGTNYTPQYDFVSMTNYFFLEFGDSTSVECWFDNAASLEKKYNLALSYGLKGVGIWALGYDNGYTDLWQLLDNQFTTDTTAVVNPINEADGFPVSMGSFMMRYRDILTLTYLLFALSLYSSPPMPISPKPL